MITVIRHLNPDRPYGQDLARSINLAAVARRRHQTIQRALAVLTYCLLAAALGLLAGRLAATL